MQIKHVFLFVHVPLSGLQERLSFDRNLEYRDKQLCVHLNAGCKCTFLYVCTEHVYKHKQLGKIKPCTGVKFSPERQMCTCPTVDANESNALCTASKFELIQHNSIMKLHFQS